MVDNKLGGFCFSKTPKPYDSSAVVIDTCQMMDSPFWDALRLSDRRDRHIQLRNQEKSNPPDYAAWLNSLPRRFKEVEQTLKRLYQGVQRTDMGIDGIEPELKFIIEPPATMQELELVEVELGRRLPSWLRDWFLRFSRSVDIWWNLPLESINRFPQAFLDIVKVVSILELTLVDLPVHFENSFISDEEDICDPDDRMNWSQIACSDMVILATAADGASLAAVISGPYEGAIVKLDDARPEFECTILADSIMEFIDTWLSLFCIDLCVYSIAPFFDFAEQRLRADTDVAAAWRKAVLELGE